MEISISVGCKLGHRSDKGSSVVSGVCALIDDKLRLDIVKVAEEITSRRRVIPTTNFDNVMVQFIINKSTDG